MRAEAQFPTPAIATLIFGISFTLEIEDPRCVIVPIWVKILSLSLGMTEKDKRVCDVLLMGDLPN